MSKIGLWIMVVSMTAAAVFALYVFFGHRHAEKKRPLRKGF